MSSQNVIRLCEGDTLQNFAVPITSGSIYNWTIGTQNIATITSGNGTENIQIDLNNTGVFWIHVLETNANLCTAKDSILVEVYPKPNPLIYAESPVFFCEGSQVVLTSDSMYSSLIWNNGFSTQSVSVDTSGLYFIIVSDTNGCLSTSNGIDIVVYPNPIADFWIDGVCFQLETNLVDFSSISSGNIVSWIWSLGDGNYSSGENINHLYQDANLFDVSIKVISDMGCSDSATKQFQIFHIPDADFNFNPRTASTLHPEVTFTNTTIDAIPILWDFDDGRDTTIENPIHVFSDPGMYEVMLTVSDSNNCIDSVLQTIKVMYDFIIYLPNTFTPDGDGKNEVFIPKGFRMAKLESYQFIVYNRWGEIVFNTEKVGEGWNGKNAIGGKYAWAIIITDEMGVLQKKVGEVLLIK
ncbi:PKD domain-containing protein [Flavobacteriales bacterium]|nr:PKD domain-containing protein [Flavobacteriales bacterium]